jgi:hypothetical protein
MQELENEEYQIILDDEDFQTATETAAETADDETDDSSA